MNIALIGYGRMGHEIEAIALKRGHVLKLIVDAENAEDLNKENLRGIDVAIEFSSPQTALDNVIKCLSNGVPVVSGATGWGSKYAEAAEVCRQNRAAFIHSSNFSIGVNLLFRLNRELAKQMERYRDYTVSIEEIHHTKKLDAPSGTAITIADGITAGHNGYTGWSMQDEQGKVPIKAVREGEVPGTHIISWDSEIDTLTLKHEAKNRKGFAVGAVMAAEFICGREGIFTMSDVMGF